MEQWNNKDIEDRLIEVLDKKRRDDKIGLFMCALTLISFALVSLIIITSNGGNNQVVRYVNTSSSYDNTTSHTTRTSPVFWWLIFRNNH